MECSDYRTISLMSHLLKLILRMIMERCQRKIDGEISENQSGFRGGYSTDSCLIGLSDFIKDEIVGLFGPTDDDAYAKAASLVMVGKPSQLANKMVDLVCQQDVKLKGCCCARTAARLSVLATQTEN